MWVSIKQTPTFRLKKEKKCSANIRPGKLGLIAMHMKQTKDFS